MSKHPALVLLLVLAVGLTALACTTDPGPVPLVSSRAYSGHESDSDANNFVRAYPSTVGERLDDCQLCHQSGTQASAAYLAANPSGTALSVSSIANACAYCHLIPFPDTSKTTGVPATYADTLNAYGTAYLNGGRSVAAIKAIASQDSDGDSYSNSAEIADNRFPGNAASTPALPFAQTITLTMAQVQGMTQHPEFLLLNANKQQYDFYAEYTGPKLLDLLVAAGVDLTNATGVSVFAPDGFKTSYTPMSKVNAAYPDATFYVAPVSADSTLNFCQYPGTLPTNPATSQPYADGDSITDLWMTVAWERDGTALSSAYLDATGRLQGEGPFRVIPPQSTPSGPDRGSGQAQANPNDGWNYLNTLDHNAGSSPRGACIIRIDPMPAGYEEYDTTNGWSLITDKKIVIYGQGVN